MVLHSERFLQYSQNYPTSNHKIGCLSLAIPLRIQCRWTLSEKYDTHRRRLIHAMDKKSGLLSPSAKIIVFSWTPRLLVLWICQAAPRSHVAPECLHWSKGCCRKLITSTTHCRWEHSGLSMSIGFSSGPDFFVLDSILASWIVFDESMDMSVMNLM
jgi:hypothetical protein